MEKIAYRGYLGHKLRRLYRFFSRKNAQRHKEYRHEFIRRRLRRLHWFCFSRLNRCLFVINTPFRTGDWRLTIVHSVTIKFGLSLLALCPCCATAYDLRFSANLPFLGRFTFACWQTYRYINSIPNKSKQKNEKKCFFWPYPWRRGTKFPLSAQLIYELWFWNWPFSWPACCVY